MIKALIARLLARPNGVDYAPTYLLDQEFLVNKSLPYVWALSAVAWLPYLKIDAEILGDTGIIAWLRIGLTAATLLSFAFYYFSKNKHKGLISITVLGVYLFGATGSITALSGPLPSYMGGFSMIIMMGVLLPIPYYLTFLALGSAWISFLSLWIFSGINLEDPALRYSFQDSITATVVSCCFVVILYNVRYRAYRNARLIGSQKALLLHQKHSLEEQQTNLEETLEELRAVNAQMEDQNQKLELRSTQLRKAHDEIHQKNSALEKTTEELHKKNVVLTDSIRYSKRIQDGLLPKESIFSNIVSHHYFLRLPRDIVSGDFLWAYQISDEKIVIVMADCTGHGVPGAFMSLIGQTLLQRIVGEQHITNPSEILNRLHKGLGQILQQDSDDNEGGMDASVCLLSKNGDEMDVKYSSAHSKIFILRNGDKIETLKGSAISLGDRRKKITDFSTQEFTLCKGEKLTLLTDGIIDQCNPKGNKIGTPRVVEWLQEFDKNTFEASVKEFEKNFYTFKNGSLQRDDISVFILEI